MDWYRRRWRERISTADTREFIPMVSPSKKGRNSISHNNVKAHLLRCRTKEIMWIGTHLGGSEQTRPALPSTFHSLPDGRRQTGNLVTFGYCPRHYTL